MICYLFDVTEDHEHFIGRVEIPYCCFGLGTESIFVNLLSMVVNPGCYNDVLKSSAPICELGPYERERFDDQLPPKSSILEIRVNGKLLQFKNYGWVIYCRIVKLFYNMTGLKNISELYRFVTFLTNW
jgi:hypothetical protein